MSVVVFHRFFFLPFCNAPRYRLIQLQGAPTKTHALRWFESQSFRFGVAQRETAIRAAEEPLISMIVSSGDGANRKPKPCSAVFLILGLEPHLHLLILVQHCLHQSQTILTPSELLAGRPIPDVFHIEFCQGQSWWRAVGAKRARSPIPMPMLLA